MRCPKCGSTAQPKIQETEYREDGWEIEVIRTYKCGCGCWFTGTALYHCQDCYELIEELPEKFQKEVDKPPFSMLYYKYN